MWIVAQCDAVLRARLRQLDEISLMHFLAIDRETG
jgi:hypothetical protein